MCLQCLLQIHIAVVHMPIEESSSDRAVISPVVNECFVLPAECIPLDTSALSHGM